MPLDSDILALVRRIALSLPPTALEESIRVLEEHGGEPCDNSLKQKLLIQAPTPGSRHLINSLVKAWSQSRARTSASAMASALATAAYSERAAREELSVQLVWTGPTEEVPVRMTSQVLLQVIEEAREELLIFSFAVYNIPEIIASLTKATGRGVRLRIVAEMPEESEGKVSFGALPTLGEALIRQSRIYFWPKGRRPVDAQGRHGSLHAKFALADDLTTYVTSANLTGYAMRLNMEMGVLIRSRDFALQVKEHIDALIDKKILELYESDV